jgi:hypothetical protein
MKGMAFTTDGEYLACMFEWLRARISRVRAEREAREDNCDEGAVGIEALRDRENRLQADIDARLAAHRRSDAFDLGLDKLGPDITQDERTIVVALVAPAISDTLGDDLLAGLGAGGGAWVTVSDLMALVAPGDIEGWVRARALFEESGKLRAAGIIELRSASSELGARGLVASYVYLSEAAFRTVVGLDADPGAGR